MLSNPKETVIYITTPDIRESKEAFIKDKIGDLRNVFMNIFGSKEKPKITVRGVFGDERYAINISNSQHTFELTGIDFNDLLNKYKEIDLIITGPIVYLLKLGKTLKLSYYLEYPETGHYQEIRILIE